MYSVADDRRLRPAEALGLTDRCLLRVCKAGEPCIVEVKATRIGLSRTLARGVFVVPEATA
jgi:Fe2+ transport system protein FeoA